MNLGLGGIIVLGLYIRNVDVIGAVGLVVQFGFPKPQVGTLEVGIRYTVFLCKGHKIINWICYLYLFPYGYVRVKVFTLEAEPEQEGILKHHLDRQ